MRIVPEPSEGGKFGPKPNLPTMRVPLNQLFPDVRHRDIAVSVESQLLHLWKSPLHALFDSIQKSNLHFSSLKEEFERRCLL
jgi:hypothetical protein